MSSPSRTAISIHAPVAGSAAYDVIRPPFLPFMPSLVASNARQEADDIGLTLGEDLLRMYGSLIFPAMTRELCARFSYRLTNTFREERNEFIRTRTRAHAMSAIAGHRVERMTFFRCNASSKLLPADTLT